MLLRPMTQAHPRHMKLAGRSTGFRDWVAARSYSAFREIGSSARKFSGYRPNELVGESTLGRGRTSNQRLERPVTVGMARCARWDYFARTARGCGRTPAAQARR
jgi:hypothetical protein